MKKKDTIISGIIWKFGERLSAQLVSFAVSVVLARLLSPNDYGVIALVLVFINIADVFVTSGFTAALIQNKDADETDFSTIFYCSAICSVVIYGILFLVAPLIAAFYDNTVMTPIVRVFSLKIPLSVYNSVQNAYISRHLLFKKAFYSTFTGTLFSGVIGILLAYCGLGVWALIAQYFTNTIINTIVLCFTVRWYPKWTFSLSRAKVLMNFGSKILFADLSGTFFGQLRSLIIGKFYSPADLAYYNKGQQLPNLITANISSSVMAVLFPVMSNENDDVAKVKNMTKQSIRMISYVMFPMLLGLAAVAEPLVIILYTEKWISCVPFVRLLCISAAISLLSNTSLQAMKAIGRGDVILNLEFIKKPLYVVLLIVGVKYSVAAVAITMIIYDIYATVVNMGQLKKLMDYSVKEQLLDIAPAVVLSGIMLCLVGFIQLNNVWLSLIAKVICGATIYVLCSAIMKNENFMHLRNYLVLLLSNKH